jgi:sugar (pentulose or hexulose) kinase
MAPVIAIFDIGKTNKKFFLIDEQYKIVLEQTQQFDEIVDEDGYTCDDVQLLSGWVVNTLTKVLNQHIFDIKAVNFSTYGASFVHINEKGKVITPLYNYLKPFPENLKQQFYNTYGGELKITLETASPVLGNLNSGMQLYWLKLNKPHIFNQIKYALHLPQYISYLITGNVCADITSIGCHTQLWNFQTNNYHSWLTAENILQKMPPLQPSDQAKEVVFNNITLQVGSGLHDSSAALIPYLSAFAEPFVLISTGTWCISLNPFSNEPLTVEELEKDCLCYIEHKGNPIKAARLFAGYEHEQQTKKIAAYFNLAEDFYKYITFNVSVLEAFDFSKYQHVLVGVHTSSFGNRALSDFGTYEAAYHQLMADIVLQQKASTSLVLDNNSIKRIFVDGGFSKNPVYMNLLAAAFPEIEVFAASVSQATAIGAALSIHNYWNAKTIPEGMIDLMFHARSDT